MDMFPIIKQGYITTSGGVYGDHLNGCPPLKGGLTEVIAFS